MRDLVFFSGYLLLEHRKFDLGDQKYQGRQNDPRVETCPVENEIVLWHQGESETMAKHPPLHWLKEIPPGPRENDCHLLLAENHPLKKQRGASVPPKKLGVGV